MSPPAAGSPWSSAWRWSWGYTGVLYLEVARSPAHGWLVAAVGLAGKVLGPVGMAYLILNGDWPARTLIVVATNDAVWWIPFGLYLRDVWPQFSQHVAR